MKDLKSFSTRELATILQFTAAVADANQAAQNGAKFSDMPADEAAMKEAEQQAVAYANRRKAGFTSRSTGAESDEEDRSIREGIRSWMRRTNRVRK